MELIVMRFKLLFFSIMLAMLFGSISNFSAEPKMYYILFDNFDDQKDFFNGDKTWSNLIDECYWKPMSTQQITTEFYKYAQKAPFSAATFNTRDITEYDVAVFPMGPSLGLDASVDGIKVMDKIQQMLDAGKSVMIIGSAVLANAFAPSGDPNSKTFLQDFLGIDYLGVLPFVSGNTIYGCTVDGKDGDPVAQGYDIVINQKYSENGGEFMPPWRYYPWVDVFKMIKGSLAIPTYQISVVAGDSIDKKKNEWYTGVRGWNNTAKVALWTTNFDIANLWQTLYFNKSLVGGIDWATNELPRPEQYIQTDNMQYDFKAVPIGNHGYQSISIQNFGREPLMIKSIEVVPSDNSSAFQITEGGDPVLLQPLETHTFNVSFSPTQEMTYSEAIDIKSNAINGTLSLELSGEGGNVNHGGYINVTDLPVDFGTVAYGQYAEKNISIENQGDIGLIVKTVKLTEDANKFFTFPKTVKTPITIPSNDKYWLLVRFTPLDSNGGTYTGELTLESDALNQNGPIKIILQAKGASNSIKSGINISSSNIDFGDVPVATSSNYTLTITNKGSEDLIFQKTKLEGGGESQAQFSWVNNTQTIPVLKPDESWDLILKFTPEAAKTYQLNLKIISNDAANGNIVIPVQGIGKDVMPSVDDNVTPGNLIKLEVSPNPISENGNLSYTYNGTRISNLKIKMVDLTGKTSIELYNEAVIKGTQSIQFNTTGLADGKYIIVAEIDGTMTQIPIVIAR
jgi:hypothetical protein